jgi:hypothetical protein
MEDIQEGSEGSAESSSEALAVRRPSRRAYHCRENGDACCDYLHRNAPSRECGQWTVFRRVRCNESILGKNHESGIVLPRKTITGNQPWIITRETGVHFGLSPVRDLSPTPSACRLIGKTSLIYTTVGSALAQNSCRDSDRGSLKFAPGQE